MFAIRLEDDLLKELDHLAKSKRTNRSQLVREAIVRFLEDQEDYKLAMRALKHSKSRKKITDLRNELDLDA